MQEFVISYIFNIYVNIILLYLLFFKGDKQALQSEAKVEIRNIAKKLKIEDYVCGFYFKTINNPDEKFSDIWKGIKSLASKQSQWKKEIPTQWIQMERKFQQMSRDGTPIITYNKMFSVCPPNFPEPPLFIKYMRASGLVVTIHRGDIIPDDEIVIDSQWIIDAFKQVIDVEYSNEPRYGKVQQIRDGKLTREAAEEVWSPNRFKQHIDILPKIMENLGLIAAPAGETGFYYIPSLLPSNLDELNTKIQEYTSDRTTSRTYILDFRKQDVQVPFPHFDKMMAKLISGQTSDSLHHVSRYGCISMLEDQPLGFVVCYGCSVVKLTLFSKVNPDETSARRAMNEGIAGRRLIDKVLQISNAITKQFKQNVASDPRRGLSCNPFPPIAGKPLSLSYATVQNLLKQKDYKMNCCKHSSCKQVEKADLLPWDTSKTIPRRWWTGKMTLLYLQQQCYDAPFGFVRPLLLSMSFVLFAYAKVLTLLDIG